MLVASFTRLLLQEVLHSSGCTDLKLHRPIQKVGNVESFGIVRAAFGPPEVIIETLGNMGFEICMPHLVGVRKVMSSKGM